jgi:VCBS repeat-containing protein
VTLANGTPVSNGQTLTSAELQGLKYNGPDDYKAGDPVGNFTYSVNDGTTSVEGKVTLGVTPVNDAPDANDDFGVIAGLKGNYYGYREGVDGGNLQNLAGVAAFIAGRTPSATFTATELNYGNGVSNNLGNDQQLQKFLGADAASLNTDPANTSDAIIEMNGQINLNAGTYQFRVTADDGYSILVDGKVVAEFNGNQSPTARESATFTITESGPHDIQIIYWDQGGQAQLKVELRPEGGSYTVVGGAQLSQAGNDLLITNEDQPLTIEPSTLLGNDSDVDGDTLSIVSVQDAVNGSVALIDGKVVFTPNANFNGKATFTYTISDGNGKFDTATVTVGVKPVNDAPVSAPQSLTTAEDTAVDGKITPTDVDGDTLTYSIASGSAPQHGTVTLRADGTFTYVPGKDYNGQDSFTVTISDGKGGSTTSVISLDITPVNDLPVTADQTKVTDEDQSVSGQIAATDVDGDKLSYTIQSGVAHGSILLNTVTGAYTYTPNKNYNGTDSFTIRVYDTKGGYADSVVNITINPVNDAPVSGPQSLSTEEDVAISGKISATDVDGDTLTYSITNGNGPQHGTVTLNADGTFNYVPNKDYNGQDSFTVTIADGNGGTTTSVISLDVTPVNDLPVTTDQSKVTDEDQSVSGQIVASDVDGDKLSYTIQSGVAHGSILLNTVTGAYTYTPNKNYNGTDSFTIRVHDPKGGYADSVVNITINPVNDAPVANDDRVTTLEDTAVTIDVLANDTDVDGDSLLISGASAGHGSVSVVDGKLVYTPTANFSGSDTISYSISDGKGGTSTASVQVTVTPVADAPNLNVQTPAGTPHATGLTLQSWDGLALGNSGNGATPATLKATIDAAGTPASSTSANDAHLDNVNASVANKLSGLIYLQAGETYAFSGVGDDSVLVSVGGTTVASATWSGTSGQFSGTFTAQQSGYYTLDVYQHNQSGPGNLDVNIKVGNGPVQDLSTANVLLYRDTIDLNGDGMRVSELHGSDGKGYYQVYGYNEGDENSSIPLSHLSANLVDTDLSESLSVSISQIPSGVTISDGTPGHSFTADGTHSEVDISGWNLNNLSLTSPSAGSFDLKVTATATEGANGDKASTSLTLSVVVHGVNDAPTSADNTVNTNEDTPHSFSSADFVFNDVDAGDSLKAIRINSLPASGNLSLGNEAVTIGMIITAAQIASLVYTPAANANGSSSFSFSVQDQSGAFSTTPNTMTIQVAAVDDAPALSNSTVSFAENIASGSTIADLSDRFTSTDQDRDGEPLFYSIAGGNDAGLFAINSSTGVITLASGKSLDYETATQHQLEVTATDGKTPVSATVTVNVTNVNEAPMVVAGAAVTGNEDTNYIFTWSDFKVSDVDANSNLSIKIESLPGEGKLQVKSGNSWVDVGTNTTVTKSVIDAGGLRFVPDTNESGHDSFSSTGVGVNKQTYAEFKYSGSDGTLSTASSTMSIDITPVADVPTLSVKSATATTLFTTTWESAPDSDYTSESIKGSTFESWTLVTTGDQRTGGTNVFEIWGHNDRMENQAGNEITIKMQGNGNNDALELNDAGSTMAQTLGITRNVATEVGKVYELSMDYAGRLGFDTSYTKIAVYLGNTLVGEYGSTSSQTSLNWENIHFSFVGTGSTEALTIKLAGSSTHASGRGALLDNISLSSSQGVVAGDGGVSGKTNIALSNYISGALTDTDGSETLRYELSSLPAGASIMVGNSTLAAVGGVVSLTAAQLADAKLQVSGSVRGEIGLDIKAVSTEPNGSTASSSSQHLTLKIIDGGVEHSSYTTNTITASETAGMITLGSGLTGEYWGYQENSSNPNLTSLSQVENYIEGRNGNNSSLVGSNANAANGSLNASFIANQIDFGLKNGSPVFSDDLGDNRNVSSGRTIGSSNNSQNNLYDFLTAASASNVSDLKAGGAGLGDTTDAIIRAHGFLSVAAGTYDIRITADDGYRLLIGGQDVANVDKVQSTTTDTFKGVNLAGGLQALELLYWDQGGHASLKVELKLSGSSDSTYQTLGAGDYKLFQAATLSSGQELVQTDAGWAVHTIQTTNGSEASDLINGSKYSDILNGGNGHDVLYGNGGHDLLNGGDGNDLLIGGVGNDTLIGGAGADTFMWKAGDFGNDVIKDFNAAEGDRIDISDLLPDTADANNLLNYLKVDTATNTLQVSTTGDLANNVDVTIKLEGVNLTQYGATSSQIVNSLVAGADPLVKTEHH